MCDLHLWQDNRDVLRDVTGVEPIPKWESAQKVDPGEENSPAASAGTLTRNLSITSPALKLLSYPQLPFSCHCKAHRAQLEMSVERKKIYENHMECVSDLAAVWSFALFAILFENPI